jgi:hypothetical protein
MFPPGSWESAPTVGWEISPFGGFRNNIRRISAIGTLLD